MQLVEALDHMREACQVAFEFNSTTPGTPRKPRDEAPATLQDFYRTLNLISRYPSSCIRSASPSTSTLLTSAQPTSTVKPHSPLTNHLTKSDTPQLVDGNLLGKGAGADP